MRRSQNHFGVSFLLALFTILSCIILLFETLGGLHSLIELRTCHLPPYFLIFDWILGVFVFSIGFTVGLDLKSRNRNSKEIKQNMLRKGFLFFCISLLIKGFSEIDFFYLFAMCYILSQLIINWSSNALQVTSLSVILLTLFSILSGVHYGFFVGFDIQDDGLHELYSVIFFKGYCPVFSWISFFISGIAFSKSNIKLKGFLPPSTLLGAILILVGFFIEHLTRMEYYDLDSFMNKFIYPFDKFIYFPGFVLSTIGMSWVIFNFFTYFFARFQSHVFFNLIELIASSKWTIILYSYLIGVFFMKAFAYNGTIILAFSYPISLIVFILIAMMIGVYLIFKWKEKVNKEAPVEWILKSISSKSVRVD